MRKEIKAEGLKKCDDVVRSGSCIALSLPTTFNRLTLVPFFRCLSLVQNLLNALRAVQYPWRGHVEPNTGLCNSV